MGFFEKSKWIIGVSVITYRNCWFLVLDGDHATTAELRVM